MSASARGISAQPSANAIGNRTAVIKHRFDGSQRADFRVTSRHRGHLLSLFESRDELSRLPLLATGPKEQ